MLHPVNISVTLRSLNSIFVLLVEIDFFIIHKKLNNFFYQLILLINIINLRSLISKQAVRDAWWIEMYRKLNKFKMRFIYEFHILIEKIRIFFFPVTKGIQQWQKNI